MARHLRSFWKNKALSNTHSTSEWVSTYIIIMKYISLDLETTAFEPYAGVILEVGVVFDDLDKPLSEAQTFTAIPKLDTSLSFSPNTLHWYLESEGGSDLLRQFTGSQKRGTNPTLGGIFDQIEKMATDFFGEGQKFLLAGKNVGFDLDWIEYHVGNYFINLASHRKIDVGNLYLRKTDKDVPSLEECKVRAGLSGEVRHRALEDALDVCALIRAHFNKGGSFTSYGKKEDWE